MELYLVFIDRVYMREFKGVFDTFELAVDAIRTLRIDADGDDSCDKYDIEKATLNKVKRYNWWEE